MELLNQEDIDSLASLEERIRKAVDLVAQLKTERDGLQRQMDAVASEKQTLVQEAEEARAQAARLAQELETLRSERKQVRTRIEKLLGQMDLLSAS
ncbi:MAG: cell division protein ZapB [Bryobacterales bacterium]|nr:cell division protein ZapB [Bryobacterales bacterium]